MHQSAFEHISGTLTVMAICRSLGPDLPQGMLCSEAYKELERFQKTVDPSFDAFNDPVRIISDDGSMLGIFSIPSVLTGSVEDSEFEDYVEYDDIIVDDFVDRIESAEIISADTKINELLDIFVKKQMHRFYVIRKDEIVGFLEYEHLFKPVARLAFLSVALEIEDKARMLCQHHSFREKAWGSLSQARKDRASELFRNRYGKEPGKNDSRELIECTYLVDKGTMIWKCALITDRSRSSFLRSFKKLEQLRNFCAHPRPGGPHFSPEELAGVIDEGKSLGSTFENILRTHGASDRPETLHL